MTLVETLEDLSARFIVNLPTAEFENMDRVCFQIEQAHWYYEDFVRPQGDPALLPSYTLRRFHALMFKTCPLLSHLEPQQEAIYNSFMAYKERVPVCGAVLISQYWDKVLLVKGWQKNSAWSFPRGKINKEETEAMCAVREVLEETGFDMEDAFPREQLLFPFEPPENAERAPYYIEVVIKEQKIRLYFVPGVSEDTLFETRTRKEISKIDWFRVSDLPTWNKKKGVVGDQKAMKYYMVTPFISHLKLWIDRNKPKNLRKRPPVQTRPDLDIPWDSSLQFNTAEEGTDALQALFFGGTPEAEPTRAATPPSSISLPPPAPLDPVPTGQTPPHLAYRRQNSLVQPKPKTAPDHVNKLLTLLTSKNPITTPPLEQRRQDQEPFQPALPYPTQHHTLPQQQAQGPRDGGNLLELLRNGMMGSKNPVAIPPPEQQRQHHEPPQSTLPYPTRHQILPQQQAQGPREGGNLLELLQSGMMSGYAPPKPAARTTLPVPPSPPVVAAPPSASASSSSPAPSILFANSDPPPEAAGFGYGYRHHKPTIEDEKERAEKRQALLRALYHVSRANG